MRIINTAADQAIPFILPPPPPPVLPPEFLEPHTGLLVASSPGHSQILSCSHGKKSGEGLGSKLRHGPEVVESVSM